MNSDFWMPHAHCVFGDEPLIAFNVLGNLLTALAYMIIPAILWRGLARIWHLLVAEERALIGHAGAFIAACSATHLANSWNWFHNNYWTETGIVTFCGIVSITFAFRLRSFYRLRFSYEPKKSL